MELPGFQDINEPAALFVRGDAIEGALPGGASGMLLADRLVQPNKLCRAQLLLHGGLDATPPHMLHLPLRQLKLQLCGRPMHARGTHLR